MMRTTRDAILHGMLMIEQPEEGPRVSVDSVLLASFVKARRKEKIIELGSAHGAVSLLLAKRFPHVTVEGLEIQAELAALAERNAVENGLQERVAFKEGDLRKVREIYPAQSFGIVVVNPPYGEANHGRPSPLESEAAARHGTLCTLEDVIKASRYLLANKGKLFMVFRAGRITELLSLLSRERIEPKRVRPVYPAPSREASVVLVQAARSAGKGATLEPPLFIQDEKGEYTGDLLAAYRIGS